MSCECGYEGDCSDIYHTTGYKDDYLVEVSVEGDTWAPTNKEIFTLINYWFESEDAEFGDGFGRWMPFFYVGLIAIDETEKAQKAYELEGREAVEHFKQCIEEHRNEIIAELMNL